MNSFRRISERAHLHDRVTRELALSAMQAEQHSERTSYPNEAQLCQQLGVSRTVLRESMKVLVDKGLIEIRPRTGTRVRPRSEWHLLDPDILAWQAELKPDARFLRDLCEVRLAIEPTAAGFAAVRATAEELDTIARCLSERQALGKTPKLDQVIDVDLHFYHLVVAAGHNPLLNNLSLTIREPFRTMLLYTSRFPANLALEAEAQRRILDTLRRKDPTAARKAAEHAVALAMLAVEEALRAEHKKTKTEVQRSSAAATDAKRLEFTGL